MLVNLPPWPELAGTSLEPVTEGMSGALLFRVSAAGERARYLKLAAGEVAPALRQEIDRTRWLGSQGVTVPTILRAGETADGLALLTAALPGMPAAESDLPAGRLAEVLAEALTALHCLAPEHCPFDESLEVRLARAARDVASGIVDPAHFDARNAAVAPEDLLARLADRPPEDRVVVHGDATLGNLIVDAHGHVGFVDCGHVGRGDRYIDLAVLAGEIAECLGAKAAARFIRTYGRNGWDRAKACYFSDLYELF